MADTFSPGSNEPHDPIEAAINETAALHGLTPENVRTALSQVARKPVAFSNQVRQAYESIPFPQFGQWPTGQSAPWWVGER